MFHTDIADTRFVEYIINFTSHFILFALLFRLFPYICKYRISANIENQSEKEGLGLLNRFRFSLITKNYNCFLSLTIYFCHNPLVCRNAYEKHLHLSAKITIFGDAAY